MRRSWNLPLLIAALVLAGCIQSEMLISVRSDGSGTLTATVGMSKAQFQMMSSMGGESQEMFDEEEARKSASGYGEGVTFVSAEKIDTDEMVGMRAVYAFQDINTVTASPMESQDEVEAKSLEKVRFSFDPADGGSLSIIMPGDPPGEAEPKDVDEDGFGIMKSFLSGMKMSMKIEIEPGIATANVDEIDGNVVTLFEIDFDQIAADDDNLRLFMQNSDSGARLVGVDGVTYVKENPVVIDFAAAGGRYPIWYIGMGAVLLIVVAGLVLASRKNRGT